MRIGILLLSAPLLVAACSAVDDVKPKAPVVTTQKATLTKVSPQGLEFLVEIAVTNPNEIKLEAQDLTAKITLDGQYDMGTVEVPQEVDLPSDQEVQVSVPLAVDWKDISVVATLVAEKRSVPYDIDGEVKVGVNLFKVNVPFHVKDVITEEQLRQALPGGSTPLWIH